MPGPGRGVRRRRWPTDGAPGGRRFWPADGVDNPRRTDGPPPALSWPQAKIPPAQSVDISAGWWNSLTHNPGERNRISVGAGRRPRPRRPPAPGIAGDERAPPDAGNACVCRPLPAFRQRHHPRLPQGAYNRGVPPSDTPESVAGEAGPVPRWFGENARRRPGARQKMVSPSPGSGGACLCGTHDWTGDWALGPFVRAGGHSNNNNKPSSPPWKRCRHPRRETEVAVAQDTEAGHVVCHHFRFAAGTWRVPADRPARKARQSVSRIRTRTPARRVNADV